MKLRLLLTALTTLTLLPLAEAAPRSRPAPPPRTHSVSRVPGHRPVGTRITPPPHRAPGGIHEAPPRRPVGTRVPPPALRREAGTLQEKAPGDEAVGNSTLQRNYIVYYRTSPAESFRVWGGPYRGYAAAVEERSKALAAGYDAYAIMRKSRR